MVRQATHTPQRAPGGSLSQPGDDDHDDEPDHDAHVKTHHDDEDEEDDDADDGETTTTTAAAAAAATTTTTTTTEAIQRLPRSPARPSISLQEGPTGPEGTPPASLNRPPRTPYKIMFPEVLPGT